MVTALIWITHTVTTMVNAHAREDITTTLILIVANYQEDTSMNAVHKRTVEVHSNASLKSVCVPEDTDTVSGQIGAGKVSRRS